MFGLPALPPIASASDAISPLDVLAGWPDRWPLTALWSCPTSAPLPWSRWTLLGVADAPQPAIIAQPAGITHPAGTAPTATTTRWTPPPTADGPPGVWVGAISYECALAAATTWQPRHSTAPTPAPPTPPTSHASPAPPAAPRPLWHRVTRGFIYDTHTSQWFALGGLTASDLAAIAAQGAALRMARSAPVAPLGPLGSNTGRARFTDMVRSARAAIAAGDVYQVNLAHLLRGPLDCHPRDAFGALADTAAPWMGAYLQTPPTAPSHPHHALISLSPELFLRLSADGRVVTRPIKGTRRAAPNAHQDLLRSDKERAELTMIVDLMRNDLGRVCLPGSVTVPEPRTLEHHGAHPLPGDPQAGVWHATATITGTLRPGATRQALLDATLPPGSISGAPKASALSLIRRLEAEPRGHYCGVIGWLGDDGSMALSVAIRTASVVDGTLTYGVGAGVVHDSDPDLEWDETLAKAAVLAPLQHPPTPARTSSAAPPAPPAPPHPLRLCL